MRSIDILKYVKAPSPRDGRHCEDKSSDNEKFGIFISEIYQMSISMIEDGIASGEDVLNGNIDELSWGSEASQLLIRKTISTLEYHGNFVSEIPAIEIYKMLTTYKSKLQEYESWQM